MPLSEVKASGGQQGARPHHRSGRPPDQTTGGRAVPRRWYQNWGNGTVVQDQSRRCGCLAREHDHNERPLHRASVLRLPRHDRQLQSVPPLPQCVGAELRHAVHIKAVFPAVGQHWHKDMYNGLMTHAYNTCVISSMRQETFQQ
ncbi:hypothetical protein ORF037R [Spotted knifejaw iridovirus]|nr:hypothetical protein ORF037R [Spotted knifejaw iridovirus]